MTTYSGAIVTITYVASDVAVDNIMLESKAQKVMRDGQIIIIKDGKEFDILGNEIVR
jgi:hypothetical protein